MSYSIVENTATSFIENRNIKLPRFQRKQTWKEKDNFKLCISVYKGYPIGVVIINSQTNPESIDWLLDGRQRRNALIEMRNNPVSVYFWSKSFVKFGYSDPEEVIIEKFWAAIDEYLQSDKEQNATKSGDASEVDNQFEETDDEYDECLEIEEAEQASFNIERQHQRKKEELYFWSP